MREAVQTLVEKTHAMSEAQILMGATVDSVKKSTDVMQPNVALIPDLKTRVTLLERIVYGACAVILIAVLTALIRGVVILPPPQLRPVPVPIPALPSGGDSPTL